MFLYSLTLDRNSTCGFVRIALGLSVTLLAAGAGPEKIDRTGGTGAAAQVDLLDGRADHIVLRYDLNDFSMNPVKIDGRKYAQITLGKESRMKVVGAPALPNVCRSVIIPDDARMAVSVLASEHYELAGIDVAPSKGFIPRTLNPKDVPYRFGDAYTTDAYYPGDLTTLRTPYILRDHRGTVIELNPFQYNPVTRILRVYTNITVAVSQVGPGQINVLKQRPQPRSVSLAFDQIYSNHFANYDSATRYTPLTEAGDMLIICHDAWLSTIQPLVDHKNDLDINTAAVGVSTIGNNPSSIKSYIQNVYDTSDLAFVLLVGDAGEIASPSVTVGMETESADPTYALLAGSDSYPDILVGRFSAQTGAQVDTQVERTIEYEQMPATAQDWFKRATGIASDEGPGDDDEMDFEHVENIRTDLLGYEYVIVDQIYDPGATKAEVADAVNAGRGLINYTGHGSSSRWSTSGFSNSDVDALTNDNMLPLIFSVACNNGTFDGYTCFAETWLRATHGTEPTGAVAMYASSVSQHWEPPMCAQDEFVDLLVAETYSTFGALCFAGSCQMMDEYGVGGVEMYKTWHVFGDPSLRVFRRCSDQGAIRLDRDKYACDGVAAVSVIDCGLNTDNELVETVTITVASDSEPAGESVLLTETGAGSAEFEGSISLNETDSAGVLQISNGETVTATYIDADDGLGGTDIEVSAMAVVDCQSPQISNVQTTNVEARSATVTFDADEPVRGIVRYGESCDALIEQAESADYAPVIIVDLAGLDDVTTYHYAVDAEDEAGNMSTDDNGGVCYNFTTPEVPEFFTELFHGGSDLDGLSILFTPSGGNDFYEACAGPITVLPTDPAGGAPLALADDDFAAVSLSDSATVSLYGTSYSTFYVGSNGYITFVYGDGEWEVSLANHFNAPRISGLFDDLNPATGGTITWEQLTNRVVVTWSNVPEWGESNSNTFQVEMYFSGQIRLSYLSVPAVGGLAGLSAGNGVDPEFYETDLSAVGACDCNDNGVPDDVDIAEGTSLDCNNTGVPDDCDIATGVSEDNNGNGIPDECDCPPTEAPQQATGTVAANRYMAFVGGNSGRQTAMRVTFTSLPAPFDVLNGQTMWVGEPQEVSENAGKVDPSGAPGWPSFTAATLQCDPLFTDWSAFGVVHVFHEAVIPGATYEMRALDEACDFTAQGGYSTPLELNTSLWGDVVRDCVTTPCGPPDGSVDIATDAAAVLDKFKNLEGAPVKARCDLEPNRPDARVNISDVTSILDAFRGFDYPFAGPLPCPPP